MKFEDTKLNDWVQLSPEMIPVTTDEPHCPFCGEQLSDYCGDYACSCKCGYWYTEDSSFKRTKMTPEEQQKDEALRIEKRRKSEDAKTKRELTIYNKVKAYLEANGSQ